MKTAEALNSDPHTGAGARGSRWSIEEDQGKALRQRVDSKVKDLNERHQEVGMKSEVSPPRGL